MSLNEHLDDSWHELQASWHVRGNWNAGRKMGNFLLMYFLPNVNLYTVEIETDSALALAPDLKTAPGVDMAQDFPQTPPTSPPSRHCFCLTELQRC